MGEGQSSLTVGEGQSSLAVGEGQSSLAVGEGQSSLTVGEGMGSSVRRSHKNSRLISFRFPLTSNKKSE